MASGDFLRSSFSGNCDGSLYHLFLTIYELSAFFDFIFLKPANYDILILIMSMDEGLGSQLVEENRNRGEDIVAGRNAVREALRSVRAVDSIYICLLYTS